MQFLFFIEYLFVVSPNLKLRGILIHKKPFNVKTVKFKSVLNLSQVNSHIQVQKPFTFCKQIALNIA